MSTAKIIEIIAEGETLELAIENAVSKAAESLQSTNKMHKVVL